MGRSEAGRPREGEEEIEIGDGHMGGTPTRCNWDKHGVERVELALQEETGILRLRVMGRVRRCSTGGDGGSLDEIHVVVCLSAHLFVIYSRAMLLLANMYVNFIRTSMSRLAAG